MFGAVLNRLATSVRRALSDYSVGNQEPNLALDFVNNKYITNNSSKNFSNAITHSRSGNATMTDGYGPELVVNGGFDSDSDWTKGTGWTIADGVASHTGSATGLTQSGLTVGKTYAIEFDILNYRSNTLNVYAGTAFQGGFSGNGRKLAIVTATGNGTLQFYGGLEASIDNVSVREMPVLKWAPHNLLSHSEQFDNADWSTVGVNVTSVTTDLPTGASGTAYRVQDTDQGILFQYKTLPIGVKHTVAVWAKLGTGSNGVFRLHMDGNQASSDFTATSEWQLFEFEGTPVSGGSSSVGLLDNNVDAYDIIVWGMHLYRSDLGGMVDNPDRGDSYVPTTSSAVYLPRVGHHVYNGSAWVNEGLLAESEARTNVATYSNFSSGFGNTRCTRTPDAAVSPDGTQNASEVIETIDTGSHFISTNTTVTASVAYTLSCYFKQSSGSRSAILRTNNVGTTTYAVFDFATGTITETGADTRNATVENVGNGWYRVSFTYTQNATTLSGIIVALSNSTTPSSSAPSYTGDGTSGIYIYGVQFEQGSTPSSFIPTDTGASVTRAAETFTIPSANLPWPDPNILNTAWTADLSSDTDWALTGNWTVSSNALSNSGSAGYDVARYDEGPLVNGKVYELVFDINSVSGNGVRARYNGSILDTFTTTGTKKLVFVATVTASEDIDFQTNGASVSTSIDNISVREIDPLSVSIAMDGRMTYADTSQVNELQFFEWRKDGDNFIYPRVRTTGSATGRLQFLVEANNLIDAASSGDSYFSPDILVPYSIAGRHGSTFVNGAEGGVALTADTTPVALPDLSASDLDLAYDYMGTIGTFRVWDKDLGDTGLVEATNPSLEPSLSLTFEGTGTNSFIVNDWSE